VIGTIESNQKKETDRKRSGREQGCQRRREGDELDEDSGVIDGRKN
jgi:hypothetical protein